MDVAKLREETPLCQNVIHFNNAGASPMPQPVYERLVTYLQREREIGGYEAQAEHQGVAGSEQGRDIIAWREGARWAFQCKRVQSFGPKDALLSELYGLTDEEIAVVERH